MDVTISTLYEEHQVNLNIQLLRIILTLLKITLSTNNVARDR